MDNLSSQIQEEKKALNDDIEEKEEVIIVTHYCSSYCCCLPFKTKIHFFPQEMDTLREEIVEKQQQIANLEGMLAASQGHIESLHSKNKCNFLFFSFFSFSSYLIIFFF